MTNAATVSDIPFDELATMGACIEAADWLRARPPGTTWQQAWDPRCAEGAVMNAQCRVCGSMGMLPKIEFRPDGERGGEA